MLSFSSKVFRCPNFLRTITQNKWSLLPLFASCAKMQNFCGKLSPKTLCCISMQAMSQFYGYERTTRKRQVIRSSGLWKRLWTSFSGAWSRRTRTSNRLWPGGWQPVDTCPLFPYLWALSFLFWSLCLVKQGSKPTESPEEWTPGPVWLVTFLFIALIMPSVTSPQDQAKGTCLWKMGLLWKLLVILCVCVCVCVCVTITVSSQLGPVNSFEIITACSARIFRSI